MPELRLLAGLLLAAAAAVTAAEPADIVGDAFDLETGELLYTERHFCGVDFLQCTVEYSDANEQLIASKSVDYGRSLQAPALFVQDFRRTTETRLETDVDPELVVDAGFDNFVRSRWDTLEQGDRIGFPFLIVGRDAPLDMVARSVGDSDCAMEELCLQVELDSWLLRMVVPPIQLTYDREQRRLLRFRGISNIRDPDGKNLKVDIRYRYLGLQTASTE